MDWKLMVAVLATLFITAGCFMERTPVTLHNNLGDLEITALTLTGPGDKEKPLEPMDPAGTAELQLARGSYALNATDGDGNAYRVDFTVEAHPVSVRIGFLHSIGFQRTVKVSDGVYWTGSGNSLVTLRNRAEDWTVWYVYCDRDTDPWSENRMGAHILEYGEELNILVNQGIYDVMCEDRDGDYYAIFLEADIRPGSPFVWEVTPGHLKDWERSSSEDDIDQGLAHSYGIAPVTVYNNLEDLSIWYIHYALAEEPWVFDLLGSRIVEPGEDFTFRVDPGVYDLLVEDREGNTYIKWDVHIPEEGFYWSVDPGDRN